MRALVLPTSGDARVVQLRDGSDNDALRTMYELIGCRYVDVLQLAGDLIMWLDGEGHRRPVPRERNRPAMLLGAAFDQSQVYVGPVIYTGGADRHGNTKGLSDGRLAELARLPDKARVSVVTG